MTEIEAKDILEEAKILDDSIYQYNIGYLNALEMATKALEKHIQRKPQINADKYSDLIKHYYCPTCGRYFGQRGIHNEILFRKEIYCQGEDCGQAIDWSES